MQKETFTKTIVLIGLMGAGKTTVGRRLAKALALPFVDSDHEIEKAAAMPITDIFDMYGEAEFRRGERRVIERLLDQDTPHVVALGGGAFLDDTTRKIIKAKALSIWLNADVDLLVARTSLRKTRPLLLTGDPADILSKLAKERYPIYAKADMVVDSMGGKHDKVVETVIATLKAYQPKKDGSGDDA